MSEIKSPSGKRSTIALKINESSPDVRLNFYQISTKSEDSLPSYESDSSRDNNVSIDVDDDIDLGEISLVERDAQDQEPRYLFISLPHLII